MKHFLPIQVVSCIAPNYTGIMDENTPSSQAARTSRKRCKGFRTFFKRTKNDERKRLAQRSQAKEGVGVLTPISQNVPVHNPATVFQSLREGVPKSWVDSKVYTHFV